MNYDEVIARVLAAPVPPGTPGPMVDSSIQRLFRDAIEPLAMHAVWCRRTNEALGALGMDFITSYLWGRAAALGEAEPGVVVSSFAVFEPTMVEAVFAAGRAACPRADLLAARTAATVASLGQFLESEEVDSVADTLQDAVRGLDGTGRPLFSGLRNQPAPDGSVARLWQATELAREHRGDSHIAACVAAGLDPVEMNIVTELWVGMPIHTYSATRGWSAEQLGAAAERLRARGHMEGDELSSAGMTFRSEIEATTDRLEQPLINALDAGPVPSGTLIEMLGEWSQRCVAAGAFPAGLHKLAAG